MVFVPARGLSSQPAPFSLQEELRELLYRRRVAVLREPTAPRSVTPGEGGAPLSRRRTSHLVAGVVHIEPALDLAPARDSTSASVSPRTRRRGRCLMCIGPVGPAETNSTITFWLCIAAERSVIRASACTAAITAEYHAGASRKFGEAWPGCLAAVK